MWWKDELSSVAAGSRVIGKTASLIAESDRKGSELWIRFQVPLP